MTPDETQIWEGILSGYLLLAGFVAWLCYMVVSSFLYSRTPPRLVNGRPSTPEQLRALIENARPKTPEQLRALLMTYSPKPDYRSRLDKLEAEIAATKELIETMKGGPVAIRKETEESYVGTAPPKGVRVVKLPTKGRANKWALMIDANKLFRRRCDALDVAAKLEQLLEVD